MRVARCSEIFEMAKKINPSLSKFIADATKLADKFLELSNKPVEKVGRKIFIFSLIMCTGDMFSKVQCDCYVALHLVILPLS